MALDRELIAGIACVGTVALSGLGLMFAFLVNMKSPVHPFVPVSKTPTGRGASGPVLDYRRDLPDSSHLPEFLRDAEADATAVGLEFGGNLAGVETHRAQVLGTLWLSPARDLLALCVGGRVGTLPYARIMIFTALADGRYLVTLNQRDSKDLSGLQIEDVLINARLAELLEHHRCRAATTRVALRPFTESSPHAALLGVYEQIVNARVRSGAARFVDAADGSPGMWWCYTARGALRWIFHSFTAWDGLRQIRRVLFHPMPGNPVVQLRDEPALVRWTFPEDSVRATIRAATRQWFWMAIRVNLLTIAVVATAHAFTRSYLGDFPWRNVYLVLCGYVLLLFTPASYLQVRSRRWRNASNALQRESWVTAGGIVLPRGEIRWDRVRGYRVEPVPLAPHRRQIVVRHTNRTNLLLPETPEDESILACFRERLGEPE